MSRLVVIDNTHFEFYATVDCPTCPTCPPPPTVVPSMSCHAPSVHINDSILLLADAVAVDGIEVLGCGIISWRPPPGNELEELGYIVRFFEGSAYAATTTGYRSNQQYIGTDDIGRQWAIAEDLPYNTTVYAEVSVHIQHFITIAISNKCLISIGSCSE